MYSFINVNGYRKYRCDSSVVVEQLEYPENLIWWKCYDVKHKWCRTKHESVRISWLHRICLILGTDSEHSMVEEKLVNQFLVFLENDNGI